MDIKVIGIKNTNEVPNYFTILCELNGASFESVAVHKLEQVSEITKVDMKTLLQKVYSGSNKGSLPLSFIGSIFCPMNLEETKLYYNYKWYKVNYNGMEHFIVVESEKLNIKLG